MSEKKYRPFKNAEEFAPHRDKWWKYKHRKDKSIYPPFPYCDEFSGGLSWEFCLNEKVFEDGTPFGVEVEELWRPAVATDVKNPPVAARYKDSEADEWKDGWLIGMTVSIEPQSYPYLVRFGCNNVTEWFEFCEVRA